MKPDQHPALSTLGGALIVIVILVIGAAIYLVARPMSPSTSSTSSCDPNDYLSKCPAGLTTTSVSSVTSQPPLKGATTVNVTILSGSGSDRTSAGYSPATIKITSGTTVVWINKDSVVHTVVADDKSFGSKDIAAGQSFSYTFSTLGNYTYHCTYHSWMKGTINVNK